MTQRDPEIQQKIEARYTPEQLAAINKAEMETRILESGLPRLEFINLVRELGPSMQGLSDGQRYLNWLWEQGYEIEEWPSANEGYSYVLAKVPVTDVAKQFFPDYRDQEHAYLDHNDQGFINEYTEEQALAIIAELEEENDKIIAEEEQMELTF